MIDKTKHISSNTDFLSGLRNQLLDLSRRNQHVHFKGGGSFLELKISYDNLLDMESDKIRVSVEDELIYNTLDRIRIKANRNERELGFNQLKLVSVFVDWFDKESDARVMSPFLLHDIHLNRVKGVEDQYEIVFEGEPYLNPFIAYIWKNRFDFEWVEGDSYKLENIKSCIKQIDPKLDIGDTEISTQDPYKWGLIHSKAVIGNFDFRRMSLIQDYDEILKNDRLLDDLIKYKAPINQDDSKHYNYEVLATDPSQNKVINRVLDGDNLTIQGPPGTGKSQTLVNICANMVARGKSVLLVSDKRVALDVVQERLQECGLGKLSMYSHDSKRDRKSMISDLKKVYQDLISTPVDLGASLHEIQKNQESRQSIQKVVKRYFEELDEIDTFGVSLNALYDVVLGMPESRVDLDDKDKIQLPLYGEFLRVKAKIKELEASLVSLGYDRQFCKHPFSWINRNILGGDYAAQTIKARLLELDNYKDLADFIKTSNLDGLSMSELQLHFIRIEFLKKLKEIECLDLLEIGNNRIEEFDRISKAIKAASKELESIKQQNIHWINKPSIRDAQQAIGILQQADTWLKRTFNRTYKKTLKGIKERYDFSAHLVPPDNVDIMSLLVSEYSVEAKLKDLHESFHAEFGSHQFDLVYAIVNEVRTKIDVNDKYVQSLLYNGELLDASYSYSSSYERLYQDSKRLLSGATEQSCETVITKLNRLLGVIDEIDTLCYLCKQLSTDKVYTVIQNLELTVSELEWACASYEIQQRLKLRYWLKDTDATDIQYKIDEELDLLKSARDIHTNYINDRLRQNLQQSIELSEKSVVGMSQDFRDKRKVLRDARRILEHEFGKQQRYKSIRELVDAGVMPLLKQIKPIWMMGPHAVADNLNLEQDFDLVIFDEASQLRLEEGIPSCLRAGQVVIVGDEMQMPPSNFFSSKSDADVAESLLSYFGSTWSHEQLKWHYRSASRSLIDFSNKQFYNNELLIVPSIDKIDPPIKRVYVSNGKFIDRRNKQEASVIVEQLKELLSQGEKSIGIVAFSLEQADEIEDQLDNLSRKDPIFGELLNNAINYERNNCYEGLFVKNLENVQGDERDIMLISIAYAHDDEGKFRQQFGPVSQNGGERRLNVLLTRARKQKIIVTSILSMDITGKSLGAEVMQKYLAFIENPSNLADEYASILELNPDVISFYKAMKVKGWELKLEDKKTRYSLNK